MDFFPVGDTMDLRSAEGRRSTQLSPVTRVHLIKTSFEVLVILYTIPEL